MQAFWLAPGGGVQGARATVHEVVLVGGACHMPAVQRAVSQFFDGKVLCSVHHMSLLSEHPWEGLSPGKPHTPPCFLYLMALSPGLLQALRTSIPPDEVRVRGHLGLGLGNLGLGAQQHPSR